MNNYLWVVNNPDLNKKSSSPYMVKLKNDIDLKESFYQMSNCFFDAGNHMNVKLVNEANSIYELDLWIFSIIYMYRHSLELIIKAIIFKLETDCIERKKIISKARHDLKIGIDKVFDLLNIDYKLNKNSNWLYLFLCDISSMDKESDMFRYPFDLNSNAFYKNQTEISLEILYHNMSRAYDILKKLYHNNIIINKGYTEYIPKLFVSGGNYYNKSVIGYKFSEFSFFPLKESYKLIAEELKNSIINEGRKDFIFPLFYLLRNLIELALKDLLFNYVSGDTIKIMKKKKHSILGLWNSIESTLQQYQNNPKDKTLDDAKKHIMAIHSFDEKSDKFRYPCDKMLMVYFDIEESYDLNQIYDVFMGLFNLLDAADVMIGEYKNLENEYNYQVQEYLGIDYM